MDVNPDGKVTFTMGVQDGKGSVDLPATDSELPWQESRVAHNHEGWRAVRVVLCTAIFFAFLSYLAYLSQN